MERRPTKRRKPSEEVALYYLKDFEDEITKHECRSAEHKMRRVEHYLIAIPEARDESDHLERLNELPGDIGVAIYLIEEQLRASEYFSS